MTAIAVIGAQWGDEGKGKIVDLLAPKVNYVVRYSGGDNAGHTVINSYGEFKLHLIPSGICASNVTCVIANGVAINPAVLVSEMDQLNRRGVDTSRLVISDRAHVIMPYHIILDGLEEDVRGGKAVGTTRRGIGPVYADKIARLGIRTSDLLDRRAFRERLLFLLDYKNLIMDKIYGAAVLSFDTIYDDYCQYGARMAPYIRETTSLLDEALRRGELVLLEGAQGTMLDPDFGTYPYTTSSSPLIGGASLGSGISPNKISRVIGVYKAYCTRVGGGPMPTELNDETGNLIRERAHEFGTTTGRPRRCGWFDAVAGRFSQRLNGYTGVALTRLDVLDTLSQLKICTAYKINGKTVNEFPASLATLAECQPVYEELPGWETPISDIREYAQLPAAARRYVARLSELLECPVDIVSVGARREQTIILKDIP